MGSRGSSQLATGPDKTLRDWESRSGALFHATHLFGHTYVQVGMLPCLR